MGLLENIALTGFLGSDFLKWLWFMSERNDGIFNIKDIGHAQLAVNGRFRLEKVDGSFKESFTYSGCQSENCTSPAEARLSLFKGKAIKEAGIKLIIEDNEWSFTLDSKYLDIKSMKPPKTEKIKDAENNEDDSEGRFYERVFLIERAVVVIDSLFASFMAERIGDIWNDKIISEINTWLEN
jgi:hypothetical protein